MSERLGEFEQLILFALLRLDDDAFGVRIRQEISGRTGREVSAGAVYTALGRLERRGLVSSREGDTAPARGGRRRKYYRLLAPGAVALQRSFGGVARMAVGMLEQLAGHLPQSGGSGESS